MTNNVKIVIVIFLFLIAHISFIKFAIQIFNYDQSKALNFGLNLKKKKIFFLIFIEIFLYVYLRIIYVPDNINHNFYWDVYMIYPKGIITAFSLFESITKFLTNDKAKDIFIVFCALLTDYLILLFLSIIANLTFFGNLN